MKPYTYTASDGSYWLVTPLGDGCRVDSGEAYIVKAGRRWAVCGYCEDEADAEAAIEALIAEREGEK